MGLLSFLLGACSKQPAAPTSKFQAGQVWAFTPPTNQPNAKLTILRVESDGKLGTIVHIAISGVSYGDGQTTIQHLPFAESAIAKSITTLERESGPVPDFEDGYRQWRQAFVAGKGGVFTITVAEAFDAVTSIAQNHEAEPKLVKVYLNPLIMLLAGAEKQNGRPLTQEEVLHIRDTAVSVMMTPEQAKKFYKSMDAQVPVHRMNPDRVWEEWQEIRNEVR
jgi:hypothetical protein